MKEVLFFINSRLFCAEMREDSECRMCIKLNVAVETISFMDIGIYEVIFCRCDVVVLNKKMEFTRTEYHCFDDNIQLQCDGRIKVIEKEVKRIL